MSTHVALRETGIMKVHVVGQPGYQLFDDDNDLLWWLGTQNLSPFRDIRVNFVTRTPEREQQLAEHEFAR